MKSVLDILEEYQINVKKEGDLYRAFCPFHADTKKPNFTVYPNSEEGGSWFCYACSIGGDAIALIANLENISYREAKTRIYGDQDAVEILKEKIDGLKVEDDPANFSFATNLTISRRFHTLLSGCPKEKLPLLFKEMQAVDAELGANVDDKKMREIVRRVLSITV